MAVIDPEGQRLTVAEQRIGEVTEINHNGMTQRRRVLNGRVVDATDGQTGAPSRAMPRRLPLPSASLSQAKPLKSCRNDLVEPLPSRSPAYDRADRLPSAQPLIGGLGQVMTGPPSVSVGDLVFAVGPVQEPSEILF